MIDLRSMNLNKLFETFESWCEEDLPRNNFRWITHISRVLHPELVSTIEDIASHRGETITLGRLKSFIKHKYGSIRPDDIINQKRYIELIMSIIELNFGLVVFDH